MIHVFVLKDSLVTEQNVNLAVREHTKQDMAYSRTQAATIANVENSSPGLECCPRTTAQVVRRENIKQEQEWELRKIVNFAQQDHIPQD